MKIFRKIVTSSIDFFTSFKSDNRKQMLELEKLEKQIKDQQIKNSKHTIAPFVFTNRMFVKFWAFGLLVIFFGLLIYQSLSILYLIFMAYIISLAMEAIIDFLQKKIHYRGISIIIAYLFIVIVFLGAMVFIIPFLLNQLSIIITIFINNVSDFQTILATKSLLGVITDIHRLP
jgi:hypothetical protein